MIQVKTNTNNKEQTKIKHTEYKPKSKHKDQQTPKP